MPIDITNLVQLIASDGSPQFLQTNLAQAADALTIKDKDLTVPADSLGGAAAGDAYIVAAGATGYWAGQDGRVAVVRQTGWIFLVPKAGWLVWVQDESKLYAYNGSSWASVGPATGTGVPQNTNSREVLVDTIIPLGTYIGSNLVVSQDLEVAANVNLEVEAGAELEII